MAFPKDFAWGAAAASYQVEGGVSEDGRGLSIWDVFSHTPGKTFSGHTGDVACDHYHRCREDVALMRELGLRAYRFSVAWPRVLPDGTGKPSDKGLDFYDRLVDALLASGITPYVTLFHWDLPYQLYCRGSWLNRDSADWFAEYARVVAARLGDRVAHWITLNEPSIFIAHGYGLGKHAPGDLLGFRSLLRAVHHVLLSHGRGVQAIRAAAGRPVQVGWTHACGPGIPASEQPADLDAARQHTFATPTESSAASLFTNAWWNDPVYLGKYPADGLKHWAEHRPPIQDGDMATIAQPVDFAGLNIYGGQRVRAGKAGPDLIPDEPGHPKTAYYWAVTPPALRWGPHWFAERYSKPVYIFENGMANTDWVSLDGKVHDPQRIDYVKRYLLQLEQAGQDGVDIRGYFLWSVMDNYEWAEGYKQRFGIIHVDYATGDRTPKDSYGWYKKVIETNGAHLHA